MKAERLEVRLASKDKEKILKQAEKSGLKISEYVRKSCLEKDVKSKPPDEFWELLKEIYSLFDEVSEVKQEQLKSRILNLQEIFTGTKVITKTQNKELETTLDFIDSYFANENRGET
jgi:hypothetical protein